MFVNFFFEVKKAGIPTSLREYLTLLEAMEAKIVEFSIDDFYYLARSAMVKDERHIDKFDRVFGETPVFRNAIKVFVGRDHAEFVGPRNEHGRSVEFCHVVQKQGGIYDMWFWHAVVLEPSPIILVPVPYLTVMGILGVDLELMQVNRSAETLCGGFDNAGMSAEASKQLARMMRCNRGADRIAAPFR